jgi:hypothetical protein
MVLVAMEKDEIHRDSYIAESMISKSAERQVVQGVAIAHRMDSNSIQLAGEKVFNDQDLRSVPAEDDLGFIVWTSRIGRIGH